MSNTYNHINHPEKKKAAVEKARNIRTEKSFSQKLERLENAECVQPHDRDMLSRLQAGFEGEAKVKSVLSELPQNEYYVMDRYEYSGIILNDAKSKSGIRELDHIVLNNNGVCIIIEVKNWSHCLKTVSKKGKTYLQNNGVQYDFRQIRQQKEVIKKIIPNAKVISILCFTNGVEIASGSNTDDCYILTPKDLVGFISGISYNDKCQSGSVYGMTRLEMITAIYNSRQTEMEKTNHIMAKKEMAKQRKTEKKISGQRRTEMEAA